MLYRLRLWDLLEEQYFLLIIVEILFLAYEIAFCEYQIHKHSLLCPCQLVIAFPYYFLNSLMHIYKFL